jgi:uncharacterized protein
MRFLCLALMICLLSAPVRAAEPVKADDLAAVKTKADGGDTAAQFELAKRYHLGEGVPKDMAQEAQWLKKAAAQGYLPAEEHLAALYELGEGVPQNDAEAAKWLRVGADHGDAAAQKTLGDFYAAGRGVKKNLDEAVKLWRAAAVQGLPGAEVAMGIAYETGAGVTMRHEDALRWYRKAAEQGSAVAQAHLAWLLVHSSVLRPDNVESAFWLEILAASGNPRMIAARDNAEKRFSPYTLADIKKRAAEWKPTPQKPETAATSTVRP